MRISDWSSDVCSSDLDAKGLALARDLLDALEQAQVFTAAEVDSIADGLRYRPLRSRLIASARARLGSVRRKFLTTPHDGEPHGIQWPGVAGVTVVVLTYHDRKSTRLNSSH